MTPKAARRAEPLGALDRALAEAHQARFLVQKCSLLGLVHLDVQLAVELGPGAGRDQSAHDHVFLQTRELVELSVDRRLGEHLRRFLE